MNRNSLRIAAPAAALALAFGLSACGAANESDGSGSTDSGTKVSGTLNAGGSSAQEAAVAAWKKALPDHEPRRHGQLRPGRLGRRPRAVPRRRPRDRRLRRLPERRGARQGQGPLCKGDIVEVPVYVSPIAVIYNLDGVEELNLSPKTIADIFAGKITKWDDAAIKADNPDAKLPSSKITPVHRSDDSGTTQNFTDYLSKASDGAWTAERGADVAGQGRRGCRGHLGRRGRGHGRQGHDRLRRREPGRRPRPGQGQGRRRRSTPPRPRLPPRCSTPPSPSRVAQRRTSRSTSTARSTEAGVYPIVLASYQIACQAPARTQPTHQGAG